jgi:RNA polymerase sigma-70 factor (ECF subfamily)
MLRSGCVEKMSVRDDDVTSETEIRAACDRFDHERAATLVVERYGPEILGFLAAWLSDRERAAEVFSMFAEDLWVGLPGFRFQCSARGWAYTLARNAARRFVKHAYRERHVRALGLDAQWVAFAAEVRLHTASFLRTEVRETLRSLRMQLSAEDQSLIILRVDKKLPWRELAIVLSDEGLAASDADLARETARLRKRFQLATARLRTLAIEAGILKSKEP